jgi:hypothetical protein
MTAWGCFLVAAVLGSWALFLIIVGFVLLAVDAA